MGITIGVAAVIIMVAIGQGARQKIIRQIEAMGSNLLVVNAGKAKTFVGRRQTDKITTLKLKDSDVILEECPSVRLSAPAQEKAFKVIYGNISTMTKILGTTPDYAIIRNSPVQQGEWFTEEEDRATLRLAVIGSQVRDNLFEDIDPVGEIIRINNIPFEVVGVLITKGVSTEGSNEDNQIIIPLNTALRRVFNMTFLKNIYIQVREQNRMDDAEREIRSVLRKQHRLERYDRPDDFDIQNQKNVLQARSATSGSFTWLITGLAGISLILGGTGILAVMLLSVRERTSEIGLRMAVGARPKDILTQFLFEAIILGLMGGISGV
jgi:putative ABC transport system permease protein